MKSEQREGLNIAYWHGNEYGFTVIGDVPQKDLNRIAQKLETAIVLK